MKLLLLLVLLCLPATWALELDLDDEVREQISRVYEAMAEAFEGQEKVHPSFWYGTGISNSAELADGLAGLKRDLGDLTRVEIKAQVTQGLLDEIRQLGGSVIFSSERFNAITADVPPSSVSVLSLLPGIWYVGPPDIPITKKNTTSEGLTSQRVLQALQAYPLADGRGVKVGVISDSADFLADIQASGDLPNNIVVLQDAPGNSGEGTAMMEIIHDLAPGAELYFATAFISQASFASNIIALADAGCKIIVDDVGYLTEAVYEDDNVALAVEEVSSRGVFYFSSAGNDGNTKGISQVIETDFDPVPLNLNLNLTDSYEYNHVFDGAYNFHVFGGSSIFVKCHTRMDGLFTAVLHWPSPADFTKPSEIDFDIFVFQNGKIIAYGISSLFIEFVSFQLNEPGYVQLAIVQRSGPTNIMFRLYISSGYLIDQHLGTPGAITGHPAAVHAFAIAAIEALPEGLDYGMMSNRSSYVEYFTSEGPRRIFYVNGELLAPGTYDSTGGIVRPKPDFTSTDGVSTSTPGFLPFYGTSAAAPHAAAIAALVVSAYPNITYEELRQAMMAGSLDLQDPGWDTITGFGVLDAPRVLESAGKLCQGEVMENAEWTVTGPGLTASGVCLGDFRGSPKRLCQADGTWGQVQNPCIAPCDAESYGSVTWTVTPAGSSSAGQCEEGYEESPQGPPFRPCTAQGTWATYFSNHCTKIRCPTETSQSTLWPSVTGGQLIFGTCLSGFRGRSSRYCHVNGTWGDIDGECLADQSCPAVNFARASWPPVSPGEYSVGQCQVGFSGSPKRQCLPGGIWASYVTNHCQRNYCSASTVLNAQFPKTAGGAQAVGTCALPLSGQLTLACNLDGTWATVATSGSCAPLNGSCPAQKDYAHADYAATPVNTYAKGTCVSGWTGSPQRFCEPGGNWRSYVVNHCQRI